MSDLAELIAHLRKDADFVDRDTYDECWEVKETDRGKRLREAATALDALVAENARLREALEPFASCANDEPDYYPDDELISSEWLYMEGVNLTHGSFRRARAAALAQEPKP